MPEESTGGLPPPEVSEWVFRLPDLGEGLTTGEIIEWLVKTGDQVVVDQPIVVIETTKTTAELPVPYAGRIAHRHGEVNDVLPVGAPLVTLQLSAELDVAAATRAHLVGRGPAVDVTMQDPGAASGLRRLPPKPTDGRGTASPAVRRLARELGVELRAVTGTGKGGAITRDDVQAVAQRQQEDVDDNLR